MGDDEASKAKTRPIPTPEFLRVSKTLAASQFGALQALGTAPNYLCRIAIAWAEKNPADPRAPEALHLAVRSTRYGCTDKETGRWSKAAYDLLHQRYPKTGTILIEEAANGSAIINVLNRQVPGVIAVTPDGVASRRASASLLRWFLGFPVWRRRLVCA